MHPMGTALYLYKPYGSKIRTRLELLAFLFSRELSKFDFAKIRDAYIKER